jgi:hypothetical protein
MIFLLGYKRVCILIINCSSLMLNSVHVIEAVDL